MDNVIILKAVGDIALFKTIQREIQVKGNDFIFEKISTALNDADLIFGNFEFACSNLDQSRSFDSRLDFRVEPCALPSLSSINFDVLNLANNHIMDWGKEGLITTKTSLERLGIKTIGAGENLAKARQPILIVKRDIKFGFLGYSKDGTASTELPGAPLIDPSSVAEDISGLRGKVDHIIISLHWGVELSDYPHPNDVELAHKIIDMGASVILGHHPHVLQGIEEYHSGLIFYSLGAFIFDPIEVYDPFRHKSKIRYDDKVESIIAEIRFSRERILAYSVIPTKITDAKQVLILRGKKRTDCINRIKALSENLKINKFNFYQQAALGTILKVQLRAYLTLLKTNPLRSLWYLTRTLKKKHIEIFLSFVSLKIARILRCSNK